MSRKNVSVVFFDCRLKKKLLTSGEVVYSVTWNDFSGHKFLREFSSYSDLIKFLSKINLDFN